MNYLELARKALKQMSESQDEHKDNHTNGHVPVSPETGRKCALSALTRQSLSHFIASCVPQDGFDLDDFYEAFAERAAILEFEAGLGREEAEKAALGEVLQRLRGQARP
jgi:hypothetical protein